MSKKPIIERLTLDDVLLTPIEYLGLKFEGRVTCDLVREFAKTWTQKVTSFEVGEIYVRSEGPYKDLFLLDKDQFKVMQGGRHYEYYCEKALIRAQEIAMDSYKWIEDEDD